MPMFPSGRLWLSLTLYLTSECVYVCCAVSV